MAFGDHEPADVGLWFGDFLRGPQFGVGLDERDDGDDLPVDHPADELTGVELAVDVLADHGRVDASAVLVDVAVQAALDADYGERDEGAA